MASGDNKTAYKPNLRLRVNEDGRVTLDDAFAEHLEKREQEKQERQASIRERAAAEAARAQQAREEQAIAASNATEQPVQSPQASQPAQPAQTGQPATSGQAASINEDEARVLTPGKAPVRYENGRVVADDNLYVTPTTQPSLTADNIVDVNGRTPETPAQAAELATTGKMTSENDAEGIKKMGEELQDRELADKTSERILLKMHSAADKWDREHPMDGNVIIDVNQAYPDFSAARERAKGYYAHLTPEAANQYIQEVLSDTDFIPDIVDAARRAGMNEADYVRERLAPQIQQQVYDKLVEEHAPKTTLEYIMSGAMNGLIGQIYEASILPREERNLRQAGRMVAGERAGAIARTANMATGLVADLPVFTVLGGANQFLTRGMAAAAVRNNAWGAATQIAREMLTFGEYDALNSAVGQWYGEGDVDWRKVAAASGKGALSGIGMGMFGVGTSMLSRSYIARNGFGGTWNYTFRGRPHEVRSVEAARWATDIAGKSAILSMSSVLGQLIDNPDFSWDTVNWGEEFKHALMLNLMLDVQNRVMGAQKRDGFEGGKLTDEDVRDLQRAGMPIRSERQAYDYVVQTGRLGVLNDRRLSMEQKQKLANLLGLRDKDGQPLMLQMNPSTQLRLGRTLDERWAVDEYDVLGTLNARRTFDTKEAAEAYREEIQESVEANRMAAMEGTAEARRQTMGNAESIRAVANDFGVPAQLVAAAVGKEMRGEALSEREKEWVGEVKEYADTYLEYVPTLSEETAREVAASHEREEDWIETIQRKSPVDRTYEEREALREYTSQLEEALYGSGESQEAGSPETEAGRMLYESGDTASQRQQAIRTQVARERLESVAGKDFVDNLDAKGESALYDYVYIPDEYMPLVDDYLKQKKTEAGMDAAMEEAMRPAMEAARTLVGEMSPTTDAEGEREVQLVRDGEQQYVVRRQVGDVLMVTPVGVKDDGTVDWSTYDGEVTRAMKWTPRLQAESRKGEDVVREMVPEYTAERERIHGTPTEEEVLAVEAEGGTSPRVRESLEKGKLLWKRSELASDSSDVNQGLYKQPGLESEPAVQGRVHPQSNLSEGKGTENSSEFKIKNEKLKIGDEEGEKSNLSAQWTEDGRVSDGQGGSVWAAPEQTVEKLTEDMGGDRTAALRVVRNKSKQLRRDLEESDRRLDEITDAKEYKAEWDRNRQLRDSIEYWQEVDNSITDIQREAEMPEASKKMRSLMQQLAERLGVELNVTDDMLYEMRRADRRNANKYTEADARRTNGFQTKEGGIIVNSRSVRGLSWAFGHETGHEMKDRDPEAYQRWKETILGMMDAEQLQEEIKAKRENPTYKGKTEEELTDEIANDQIGEIMADPKKLETFVRQLNPNTLKHLWDTTKKWLSNTDGVTFGDVLESAQKAGGKVLDDIRERVDVWRGFKEQLTEAERILAEAYKQLAEEIRPIGTGAFGDIYDQFVGKPKEAIEFLKTKKSGEAIGALNHKDVGDIDLVWGEEGTGKSDGYGLAKLVKYHPEVLDNLQGILNDMHITAQTDNRIQMESDTHQASVRLTWDNQKKTWLLTAFEKKNSVLGNTTDTDETSGRGKQNDTATLQNTVSTGISGGSSDIVPEPEGKQNGTAPLRNPRFEGKGTENISDVQGKGQEISERGDLSAQGEIQGLEGTSEKEVLDAVRADVERVLEENGVSGVTIKDMALNGSRMRGDAREDSDLDVVMEVEGDVREDDLFNMLADADLSYEGIKVDVNPIMRGKSGTLEEYMKRSRAYDDEMRFSAEIEFKDKKTGDDDLAFGKKFVSLHTERDREAVSGQRERFAPTAQWREGVDDVMVHTTLGTMRKKYGELHDRAKAGDVEAALELVAAVVKPEKVKALAEAHPEARVAFVHAEEATGRNALPKAYAECLEYHGLQLADIEQTNKPAHTGSDRIGRFFRRARFDGEVEAGREYILVDDHVTMGGTLRDLKDYIESKGGKVVAVSTLTASAGSTKLRPTDEQIRQLNEKGITNEQLERAGIADNFDGLTRSEAREILVLANSGGDRGPSQRREGSRTRPQVLEGVLQQEDGLTKEQSSQRIAPEEGEHFLDYARRVAHIRRLAVDTNPSEAQKEAGNYKKGHLKVDGYDITIENPRGTTRSGKDADGKEWSVRMNYDYGYIRGTEGVDGDHIDVYLSETPEEGNVYVVDQIDQKTGKFDEHKVMYGFPSEEAAREAYLSQYEEGWKIGPVTEVSREQFKKWIESSHRKTKPFSEYKSLKASPLTPLRGEGKNEDVRFSAEDKEKVFEAAKKHFGVTRDLREAAYILPDGAMLDFSGRHELDPGADSDFLSGRRTNDHRDIKQLNYEKDGDTPSGMDVHMADFIERGAIRIDANSGVINLAEKPTAQQRTMLQRLIQRNDGDVSVDFGNGDNSEHYVDYEGARAGRVLGDIDRYFDEGIRPEGNMRFSAEDGAGIDMSEVDTIEAKPEKNGAIAGIGVQLKMTDGNEYRLFVRTDDESAENYGQVEFYGKDGQDIPDEEMTKRFGSLFGAQADEVFGPSISRMIMSGNKFKYHPANGQDNRTRREKASGLSTLARFNRVGQNGEWKYLPKGALTKDTTPAFLYGMSGYFHLLLPEAEAGYKKVGRKNLGRFGDHVNAEMASLESKQVAPVLEAWRKELQAIIGSDKVTESGRTLLQSKVYDLDYALNWYDKTAQGDDEFYVKMERPHFSAESPTFYSNAQRAVEGIKQEKATPEQWLKMIEKAGGLKAGEDKWMGLSEWLKQPHPQPLSGERGAKPRTLTKQEVMDYIRENSIQVEEVNYAENAPKKETIKSRLFQFTNALTNEGIESSKKEGIPLKDAITKIMDERYGREWRDYAMIDSLGFLRIDDYADREEAAKFFGIEYDKDAAREIESVRLDYTTEGLDNKREVALTVPTIEPWNESDEIHFGDAGKGRAVAWVRFGETRDKDGNRVLVIDEIQSKRHQEGREKGYKTAEAVAEEERLVDAVGKAQEAYDEYTRRMGEKYDGAYEDIYADMKEGERAEADRLQQEVIAADERYQNHKVPDVPDAPFDKNWHELAMKRILRLAAEEGLDKVAWTTGMQQAARYDIGKVIDQVERAWMNQNTGETRFDLQPKDNSGGISLFVKDGMVTRSAREEFEGKPLADVVGKELAQKMLEMEDYSSLNIADLNLGGEGMRGFYDQMLPRFMDKYGKKWGVKTYDQEYQLADDGHVENGKMVFTTNYTWHTVDVTPEMRQSVMEGQPMFSAEAETEYRRLSDIVEKPYRIEKLRSSKPVEITYTNEYPLERKSAKKWLKENIKGEYVNEDTGVKIGVSNYGIDKVTSHGEREDAHLKSLAAIPDMIRQSIYIGEAGNEKDNNKYESYQYYVCGLKIDGDDYTAKIVVGVKNGERYYDHELTQIEKGSLIDSLNEIAKPVAEKSEPVSGFTTAGDAPLPPYSAGKDKRLFSILQTNPQEIADARAKMRDMEAEMAEREDVNYSAEMNPRDAVPRVRGGWTEKKILNYLKHQPTRSGVRPASRAIAEFESPEELKEHMFYHGTAFGSDRLKPSITMSDREIERIGGGGYGDKYWGISLTKDKKIASRFSGTSPNVRIYPVILLKNAKVIERTDFSDAWDAGEHIVELWNDGVDAVWIGQGKQGKGEQELLVLNPRAVVNIGTPDFYRQYRLGLEDNPLRIADDAAVKTMYETAKRFASIRRPVKPIKPSKFNLEEGKFEYKPEEQYNAEMKEWEQKVAEWEQSEALRNYNEAEREAYRDVRFSAEREEIRKTAEADNTWMKAPNGKQSSLAENQWMDVRTRNFKRYFGDWENDPEHASKVVDENGEPLVVYHGTNHSFTAFDIEKAGMTTNNKGIFGNGFYLTNMRQLADDYRGPRRPNYTEGEGGVMELYANIRNPFYWNSKESYEEAKKLGFPKSRMRDGKLLPLVDEEETLRFTQALKDAGYDGVVYEFSQRMDGKKVKEIVAFEPTQIKSATENIGTYDRQNPDIRFSSEAVDQYVKSLHLEGDSKEAKENIRHGLVSLRKIASGADYVENAMKRKVLLDYADTDEIMFEYGKPGEPDKNYKGGYGISHIASKHGEDTLLKVLNVLATGDIGRYVDGNKTVVFTDGDYEAVVALTKFGKSKNWLLSGWEKIEKADGNGEVSTQSTPTQGSPTFSRTTLGAAISDANLRRLFGFPKENGENIRFSSEGRSEEWKKAERELAGNSDALRLLRDTHERDIEEVAAGVLSRGGLLWADEGEGGLRKKGVKSMMGWSDGERRKFLGMFKTAENGGMSVAEAGEAVEQACREAGIPYDESDAMAGVNAIQEVLGSVETMSDLNRYVEQRRIDEAYKLVDEDRQQADDARDRWYQERYGVTYDEYQETLSHDDGGQAENVKQTEMIDWLQKRNQRQAERLAKLEAKLEELKHAELGRPLVLAQGRIIEQQQESIREAKTEVNRLKDELRYKKSYADAYRELREVKKQLSAFVRERMVADDMPFTSKRELNKLLSTIERTNTIEQMEEAITEVKTVASRSKLRHLKFRLDRLMRMKVQGVNGRNMSVAKTVDEHTRRIIEDIRGRVEDIGLTGMEDELDALRRERRQTRTAINDALKNGKTDEADTLEAHWRELTDKIQTKEEEIADRQNQKHGQGKIDVTQEINDLTEQFDKHAAGEKGVTWSEADTDRLSALRGVQIIEESKEQAIEVRKIERSIADKAQRITELREKAKDESLSEDERHGIRDEINALGRDISAEKNLLATAIDTEAESVERSVNMLEELMDKGRNSLKKRVDAQLLHRMEILSGAFSDVRVPGKEPNYDMGEQTPKDTPGIKIPISCNIGSFEYMCKRISQSGVSGEDGWIYQHFVKGDNGVMAAYNSYERNMRQQKTELNDKVTEIFGTENSRVFNTDAWTRQAAKADKVEIRSGVSQLKHQDSTERMEIPLSRGEATYLYMVWKMDDGKMKMRMQGFDEQSMQEIEDFIGPKYKELADWLQDEFLTESRARYNERYVEMYNTSMARIKNYVPLRVNKDATRKKSSLSDDTERQMTLEQRAGSLINRTVNLLPVDITKSVFDVISEHVESMEKWYAYAPVRRDLDAILSSTYFRNQLDINNAGHFKRFYDAAAVATQSYMPPAAEFGDKFMALMTRGLLSGNIAWRFATAIKQLYSATAYLGYTYDPKFAGYLAKNLGTSLLGRNIKWCIQNIPSFAERADVGDVGNYRLREKIGTVRTKSAGRFLKQLGLVKAGEKVENIRWEQIGRILQKYTQIGMLPNRAIDLFTCGLGAKSIYDYKYSELKRAIDEDGTLTGEGRRKALEEAHKKAVMEADIFYNSTQQSSNPMFMSPMQVQRGLIDRSLSAYQNNNLGYVRKMLGHALDLVRSAQFKKMTAAYEHRYVTDGMNKDEAHEKARQQTLSVMGKSLLGLFVMGWLNKAAWDRGSTGFFGWLADPLEDEDKRKENETDEAYANRMQWNDALGYLGMAARPIQGTPLGNIVIDLSEMRGYNPLLAFDELNELAKDMQEVAKHHGVFSQQMLWVLTNRALRTGGINMETLGNMYYGIEQMMMDGGGWDEKRIDLMFILNTPNKQRGIAARNLYKDASLEEYVEAVAKAEKYLKRGQSMAQWFPWMKYAEGDKFAEEYKKLQKEWDETHVDLKSMDEKEFEKILQISKEENKFSEANEIYKSHKTLDDYVDDAYIEKIDKKCNEAINAMDVLKNKDKLTKYTEGLAKEGVIATPTNEEEWRAAKKTVHNSIVDRTRPYQKLKNRIKAYNSRINEEKLKLDGSDNDTATMETIRQLRRNFLKEMEAANVEK